jgi:hypothetical protein
MKEGEEPEGEDIESAEAEIETPANVVSDDEEGVLDLTKHQQPELDMHTGFESMGGGVVKPEGAEITTVEVTKDSVNVTMNESEVKLRTYVRNRLEEHAGIKKPSLNEAKKSDTLQKLDRMIDKQFNLYESTAKKKMNEAFGISVREKFAKLNPQDEQSVSALFQQAFKNILINPKMAGIGRIAQNTPAQEKYDLLRQYVEQGGGSLRIAPKASISDPSPARLEFVGQDVKDAATLSNFRHGGTQGKTQLGGV